MNADGGPDPGQYPNLARLWTHHLEEEWSRRLRVAEDDLACAIIERDDALAAFDELAQIVEAFRTSIKEAL